MLPPKDTKNLEIIQRGKYFWFVPVQVSESPLPETANPGLQVHEEAAPELVLPAGHELQFVDPALLYVLFGQADGIDLEGGQTLTRKPMSEPRCGQYHELHSIQNNTSAHKGST